MSSFGRRSNSIMTRNMRRGMEPKHHSFAPTSWIEKRITSVSLKGELKVQKRTKPTADPKRAKWATRWIRLRGDLLAVYSDIMMWSEDVDTSGSNAEVSITLQSIVSVRVHGFVENCFGIRTQSCTYWFRARDRDSSNAWVHSIYRAIAELLDVRKDRCASFDTLPNESPVFSPENFLPSPIETNLAVPLARKRTLMRSPSEQIRRERRRSKNASSKSNADDRRSVDVPICSARRRAAKKSVASTAPATTSFWPQASEAVADHFRTNAGTFSAVVPEFKRTVSEPFERRAPLENIPSSSSSSSLSSLLSSELTNASSVGLQRTGSTAGTGRRRYVPPHRRNLTEAATVKEAVHKVGTEDDAVETQDISSSGGETPTSLTPTTTPVLSPVTSSVRPPRSPTPFFDFDESFVITPPPSPGILSTSANVAASPLKKMLDGESGADVAKSKASTTGLANIALGALSLVSGATKLDGNTKLATRRCGVCLDFGVSSVQGKRGKMEDVHVTIADLNRRLELGDVFKGRLQSFFAVYDGHSGIEAAQYAAERIHTCLVREKNFETDVSRALVDCFRRVDQEYLEKVRGDIGDGKKGCYAGTTALTVLLRENKMYVATLGDTLAVLCRRGRACPVSVKCSPGSEMERVRIEKAGGWVIEEKELLVSRLHHMKLENESVRKYAHDSMRWLVTHRVNGELAVSRALGDPDYKGEGMAEYPWFFNEKHPKRDFKADLVIPVPLVQEIELVRGDMFVLIACDGLWDVLTLEDAVEVTKTWLDEGLSPQEASAKLTNLALMLGSGDNITAIVVCLDPSKLPTKGDEPSTTASDAGSTKLLVSSKTTEDK